MDDSMNENEVVAAMSAALATAANFDEDLSGQFGIVPEGYKFESLERFQSRPNRIEQKFDVSSPSSLAQYVRRFRENGTIITTSPDGPLFQIRALIDYHEPGGRGASHNRHSAVFTARHSVEYAAWLGLASAGSIAQKTLGEFLEDRLRDVIIPDAATMLGLVHSFEVTRTAEFASATKLSDGTRQLAYKTSDEVKGAFKFPERIGLEIPVFFGGDTEQIEIHLRYDIDGGKLKFAVKIAERERIERRAFERIVDVFLASVAEEGLPALPHYVVPPSRS